MNWKRSLPVVGAFLVLILCVSAVRAVIGDDDLEQAAADESTEPSTLDFDGEPCTDGVADDDEMVSFHREHGDAGLLAAPWATTGPLSETKPELLEELFSSDSGACVDPLLAVVMATVGENFLPMTEELNLNEVNEWVPVVASNADDGWEELVDVLSTRFGHGIIVDDWTGDSDGTATFLRVKDEGGDHPVIYQEFDVEVDEPLTVLAFRQWGDAPVGESDVVFIPKYGIVARPKGPFPFVPEESELEDQAGESDEESTDTTTSTTTTQPEEDETPDSTDTEESNQDNEDRNENEGRGQTDGEDTNGNDNASGGDDGGGSGGNSGGPNGGHGGGEGGGCNGSGCGSGGGDTGCDDDCPGNGGGGDGGCQDNCPGSTTTTTQPPTTTSPPTTTAPPTTSTTTTTTTVAPTTTTTTTTTTIPKVTVCRRATGRIITIHPDDVVTGFPHYDVYEWVVDPSTGFCKEAE